MTEPASRVVDTDDQAHPRRWWILVAVCAALLIIVVDNTVLSVALPAIAEAFNASNAVLQAVVDAYVVVFSGLLVAAGAACDRFGRRRIMLIGLVVFVLASIGAALAPSSGVLVAMRGAMGVGAALVMPSTLAVLVQVFPPQERARAFGVWAAVAAVAMAAGPVLGGFLVAAWSWAGVFWINVPLAGAAALVAARLVPESSDPDAGRVDIVSAVLVTVGMSGLVLSILALAEGGLDHALVGVGALLAAVGLVVFVLRQRTAESPLMDFSLYRDRFFAGASVAATVLTLGTGSTLFVLSQYLQLVADYSPLQTGATLTPLAVGVIVGSTAGGRAPARLGYRWCIVAGFVVVCAGFAVLATLSSASSHVQVGAGLTLLGLGTGFSSPAVTSTVLGAVPSQRSGMGAALNDTHQQLGIALGVATIGTVVTGIYRSQLPVDAPATAQTSLAHAVAIARQSGNWDLLTAARDAFAHAQSIAMLLAGLCALLAAGIALIALSSHPRGRTQTASTAESDPISKEDNK